MSDGNAAPDTAQNNPPSPAPSAAPKAGPADGQAPQNTDQNTVDPSEFKQMQKRLGGQGNLLESLKGQIGQLNESISKLTENNKSEGNGDKAPAMTKQVEEFNAHQREFNRNVSRKAFRDAATDKGLKGVQAKAFATTMLDDLGDRVVVEGIETFVTDTDGKKVEASAYLTSYFETDEGKDWLPAPRAPSGDGLDGDSSSNGGRQKEHPFSALSYDEISKRARSQPGLFKSYLANHKAEYDKKKRAPRTK